MPTPSRAVATGSPAPDFTLPSSEGGKISLNDFRGKRCVVIVFLRGFA
ncbi:MAG: redoxin domain-containing protein [Chloroflexi bacterium]|nr:redoxin domain-containing protein [Chloroflexota bacterium]